MAGYDGTGATGRGEAPDRLSSETPPALPGHDGLRLPYLLRAHKRRAQVQSGATRLRSMMERTQIADVAKRHCAKLSKG